MFAVIFGITLLPYATSLDYPYGLYFNAFTKYTPYVHQRVRISINTRSSRSTRTSNPRWEYYFVVLPTRHAMGKLTYVVSVKNSENGFPELATSCTPMYVRYISALIRLLITNIIGRGVQPNVVP